MIRLFFSFLLFAPCLKAATLTNFIQILTDDQRWGDLKSYGHAQLKTPHIDHLATGVATFQQKSSAKQRKNNYVCECFHGRTKLILHESSWVKEHQAGWKIMGV